MLNIIHKKDKKYDVLVIGRATIDFNPLDYYNPLKKSSQFQKYLGGSAANIAVGLARLGKKTKFISRVSNDQFGEFVIDKLNENGVDTTAIQIDKFRKTGLTFTEMLNDSESNILMYRDNVADLALDPNEINKDDVKNSRVVIITGVSLSSSKAREACLQVVKWAEMYEVFIIFDLDYRPYTWKDNTEISIYYNLIAQKADLLIGSLEEYFLLYNDDKISAIEIVKRLFKQKAKIVIIKEGAKGSSIYNTLKKWQIGVLPIKLLKSFGGGDAYASAFISSLLENKDIETCLTMGTVSASMVVANHSSSEGLPTLEQISNFIKEKNYKANIIIENWGDK